MFILWVALLAILGDTYGLRLCSLSWGGVEDNYHLDFYCSFSELVWRSLKNWSGWEHAFRSLEAEIQWVFFTDLLSLGNLLLFKPCLAATAYLLWRRGIFGIFQQKGDNHVAVCKRVWELSAILYLLLEKSAQNGGSLWGCLNVCSIRIIFLVILSVVCFVG